MSSPSKKEKALLQKLESLNDILHERNADLAELLHSEDLKKANIQLLKDLKTEVLCEKRRENRLKRATIDNLKHELDNLEAEYEETSELRKETSLKLDNRIAQKVAEIGCIWETNSELSTQGNALSHEVQRLSNAHRNELRQEENLGIALSKAEVKQQNLEHQLGELERQSKELTAECVIAREQCITTLPSDQWREIRKKWNDIIMPDLDL